MLWINRSSLARTDWPTHAIPDCRRACHRVRTARVAPVERINERLDFREDHEAVNHALNLCRPHLQDCAVEVDVRPAT